MVILSSEFREERHFGLPGPHSTFQRAQPGRSPSWLAKFGGKFFPPQAAENLGNSGWAHEGLQTPFTKMSQLWCQSRGGQA